MMTDAEIIVAAVQALEAGNLELAGDYFTEDFCWEGSLPTPLCREHFFALMSAVKKGFPDYSLGLKVVNVEGRIRATLDPWGTHTGVFQLPGISSIPPTGQIVALPREVLEFTLERDKIRRISLESASGGALADLLEQLGVEVTEELLGQLFASAN